MKSKKNILSWVLVLSVFAASSFLVNKNATDLKVSVLPTVQAPAFDGTVSPLQKSPIWTSLTSTEMKSDYSQIPADKMQSLPVYIASQLMTPVEQLGWKSSADLQTRNAKITFSTPYMGNYKLDGVENGGSHLAVDIKVPNNTPVFAIANGVAVTVSNINTGFGVHVVLRHDNVPSLNDPSVKTTYYSSYNHMGAALVSEGQVVLKGQQVGLSGHSGTATTPHLHFQIDNDQAPWHPYWPFTYAEATAAGYDFSSAIDAGFGKEKALATTINPMMYVQKYLSYSGGSTANVPATNSTTNNTSTSTVTNPVPEIPPAISSSLPATTTTTSSTSIPSTSTPSHVISNVPTAAPATAFQVTTDSRFVVGVPQVVTIKAIDAQGKPTTNYTAQNGVGLSLNFGSATLGKMFFSSDEFTNGVASTTFTPTGEQGIQLRAFDGVNSGITELIQTGLFKDIANSGELYKAVKFLKDYSVVEGYTDGTFKPANVVSRVEALKFIEKGTNQVLMVTGNIPFKDIKNGQWYTQYVLTAFTNNIVSGYLDRTFKPNNTVTKAELLKMLLNSMNILPSTDIAVDPYSDVPKDSWFAPYVQYSKDKNLVDSTSSFFNPSTGMTRAEVAQVIYRTIVLKLTGEQVYRPDLTVSSAQADQYFADQN